MKRLIAFPLASAVLLVSGPALADHAGGELVHAGDVGPYRVEVRAARTEAAGDTFVEYRVSVLDAGSSERVQDARVSATAETPEGRRGPLELGGLGEAWVIAIPVGGDEEISWRMEVEIESSLGEATFEHPLELAAGGPSPTPEAAEGDTGAPWAVGGVVVGALLLGLILRRRMGAGAGDEPSVGG